MNCFSIFDPFLPRLLDVIHEKKERVNSEKKPIGEDIVGLYNYLSNPTIRHKVLLIIIKIKRRIIIIYEIIPFISFVFLIF